MSTAHSKLWFLEKINLLKGLSMPEMQEVAGKTTMSSTGKGEYIYFPEDPSKVVFFLKEGRVKLGSYSDDGKEIIKTVLYPGEIFGELAVVGQEKRRDFAVSLDDDVTICAMKVEDLKELMTDHPTLNMEMTRTMGERLMNVERKMESLIFKDARTRIIELIKEMANKYGKKVGEETLLKHKLTHQDLANLTATSRQTVTITLNELKEQDLLYMERGKLLIRDINALK